MYINERKDLFRHSGKNSNPYRIMLILLVIVVLLAFLREYVSGKIWPPFVPTPTPTRSVNSFITEGETHFQAGNLQKAIESFNKALILEPENTAVRVELARILTYSSSSLTTDQERRDSLNEALAVIDIAKQDEPNNADVLAMRAFVLSWLSNPTLSGELSEDFRNQAEAEALAAIQLDSNNTLAKAYYAEILIDQYKLAQAQDYIAQARENGEELMDVCRVQAYIYEIFGEYNLAIEWYEKATAITPNLTFLYIRTGVLYRHGRNFDKALELFAKAVSLNEQLGIKDPIPYMAIANTYIRNGEAMAASRNAYRALEINPYNPDTYGQVGVIYHRARNYEGAILALRCAVEGCTAEETCLAREEEPCRSKIETSALPLSDSTVLYYYTYGSVLAGLHRDGLDDYCETAARVFQQVRAMYSANEDIMAIVVPSENICRISPGETYPTSTPQPEELGTPTPLPTETPFIIPTPTLPTP